MIPCEQARQSLHPYMDGEIDSSTQLALEAHLVECRSCRAEHDSLRHIVDTVRGARPLYQPPQSLTQRSAELIAGNRKFSGQSRRMLLAAAPAAAVLLVALLPSLRTQEFSAFAAQAHSQFAEGNLALAVKTDRPEVVSEWFRHRLAFHIFVPNYPSEESKGYK
ncbi:MAG TPA: anti-sigma factor, partial [Bryobacteraceae bacterium]|nr:anti-sigma factor [Bryobacteraceae bacterium]